MAAQQEITLDENRFNKDTFPYIKEITPRWGDFDMLGHLNNVEYYRYFEFIVLNFLQSTPLDWRTDPVIPYVVESRCFFRKPVPYLGKIYGALRVARIGTSSVHLEIGLFVDGDTTPAAFGYFTHVYIDRGSERPTPAPSDIVSCLEEITSPFS